MMTLRTTLAALALVTGLFPSLGNAQACDPMTVNTGLVTEPVLGRQPPLEWHGEFVEDEAVCFASRQSGAQLVSYLVAPADIETRLLPAPVVIIGPGSGGSARYVNYLWSARDLASHGYLVLVVDPQGVGRSEIVGDPANCLPSGCPGVPFQQASNFVDAFVSALDFVETRAHPWLLKADLDHVGLAGHSLSARALSFVQGEDLRVHAVVGWDNLVSVLEGDSGASSGGGTCGSLIGGEVPLSSIPVTPRVPAMGQASDAAPGCDPTNTDPEIKKAAFAVWKAAGVPAMQVVFKDSRHGNFAQTSSSDSTQLQLFARYTRAWFDRYLKADRDSAERLLGPEVLSLQAEGQFSTDFRSAAFIPEAGIDCEDLLAGPCEPKQRLQSRSSEGRFGGSFGLLLGLTLLGLAGMRLGRRA